MVKAILSVIAGYAVMFVTVLVTFAVAYMLLGTDGAFKPGTYDVSATWLVLSSVLGFIAAVGGGVVCAVIAGPDSRGPIALVAVVLVLGVLMLAGRLLGEEPAPQARTGDVNNMEAMGKAQTPVIAMVLNPVIGAAGVYLGANFARRGGKRSGTAPAA